MDSYCWSRGSNGTETQRTCWHRMTKTGAPGLVRAQGSHTTADGAYANNATAWEALSRAGFVASVADLGQTASQGTFGNNTAQTRIGAQRTFLQGASSPLTVASGTVCLTGSSGGAAGVLNYARANPSHVSAIVGILPLVDLQDFYENRTDAEITQVEINAAYGGDVTASYATHNPSAAGNQTALAGIPIKIYYSTDDHYIPVSTVTNYKTLVENAGGTCEIQSLGAVGHTDTGLVYEDPDVLNDVADFLLEHATP